MREKIVIIIMMLFSIILIGCNARINIDDIVKLDISYGFDENVKPTELETPIYPSTRIYEYMKEDLITIHTINYNRPYKFNYWEIISSESTDPVYSFSETHRFRMTTDYFVKAIFGCITDEACEEGYSCITETGKCEQTQTE